MSAAFSDKSTLLVVSIAVNKPNLCTVPKEIHVMASPITVFRNDQLRLDGTANRDLYVLVSVHE